MKNSLWLLPCQGAFVNNVLNANLANDVLNVVS